MRATSVLRVILAIQNLLVRGFCFVELGLVVDVAPRTTIPRCGDCGAKARRVYDRRERYWRHLDVAGMTVRLRYSIRRVRCPRCLGVKTEHVAWAAPSSNFTYAFEERTGYLAQQSSKSAVAKLMRVAWRTVGDIISRVVVRHFEAVEDQLEGLRHIGIDELSYRRHHQYITVVVDHERGEVVWSRPGKNADTLREFFDEIGAERCSEIESVTIDMSQAYIKAVQERVPQARLVFDRFHVQRLVQDALDETRRDEVRAAETKEEKKSMKGTRWALQKSPWNLRGSDIRTLEQLELDNWMLYRAYLLKESFAEILNRRQVNVAHWKLQRWIADAKNSTLQHFERVARTIEKYADGILEYVRTRFTNARTEGLNGKIRTITRRSYGFHSASALIAMIFLCCGGVELTPAFSVPQGFH